MKKLILVALLLSSPALASKKHRHDSPKQPAPPRAIQYCGPMGDESMACVADELSHLRPVMVSVECEDGAAGMVRIWIDNAGEIQFSPSKYSEACK